MDQISVVTLVISTPLLLAIIVVIACESILLMDPRVTRRFPLGPYLFFAREPLPPDRVVVRRIGIVAAGVGLGFSAILFAIDVTGLLPPR